MAKYMAKLKRLLTHCQFKDYLDDALRDRLVCRLQKESTQKWRMALLTEIVLCIKSPHQTVHVIGVVN